jgi:transloator
MTDFPRIPSTGLLPTAPGSDGPVGDVAKQALQILDSVKTLGGFTEVAKSLGQTSPPSLSNVSNANGAPSIDGVTISMSPDDMAAALMVLQNKTQQAQLNTAKEGLETNKKKMEDKNVQAMNKINEWIKNCEEAAAKEKSAGIFGWLVKIFSFIAAAIAVAVAAVATAATGGAASPLLALAVMGLAGATMSLASQISQAAGGPALELGPLITKLFTKFLEGMGVPKEQAEAAGKIVGGLTGSLFLDPASMGQVFGGVAQLAGANADQIAIVSLVFTIVATIAVSAAMIAASGGTSAAATVSDIAKTAQSVGKIATGVAGAVGGVAAATQGGINIAKAGDEKAASLAQADKKKIDAMIAKLSQAMEEDREQIKKVLDEIMEGMNIVSKMINEAAQSNTQLARNIVGKGQTI